MINMLLTFNRQVWLYSIKCNYFCPRGGEKCPAVCI